MKTKFGLFSLLASLGKDERASSRRLLVRLLRDEAGSYLIYMTLLMPVLIGVAGLGTEGGLVLYTHQTLQGAADSAAVSAAKAYALNPSITPAGLLTQAEAITATYGFVDGTNGVTITVNNPPTMGPYTANSNAIEVTVRKSHTALFSILARLSQINISSSAVAIAPRNCLLALDPTAAGAVTVDFLAAINLDACGLFSNSNSARAIQANILGFIIGSNGATIGTVGKVSSFFGLILNSVTVTNNVPPPGIIDPYANVPVPTGICQFNTLQSPTTSMNPGVYCAGVTLNPFVNVTMNPGVYIFKGGTLTFGLGSTLDGTQGVTLVFTGSGANYATISAPVAASIKLTAPTSGATAGMVMFGDRNMPLNTSFNFTLFSSLKATGVLYLPSAYLQFKNLTFNNFNCLQVIANKILVQGASYLADTCSGVGTKLISSVQLVQ
jgi:Flp pilus assembly protein TadG